MSLLLVTHGISINVTSHTVTSVTVTSIDGAAAREGGCHQADAERADIRLRKDCGTPVDDDLWNRRTDRVIDAAGHPRMIDDPALFGEAGADPGDEISTDPGCTVAYRRN